MAESLFRFKQFSIVQSDATFKVGTDGVLLGAWVDVEGCSQILDVGTGTGLIALMLAQRSAAQIDAVEIDEASSKLAERNFSSSRWNERLAVYNVAFNDFVENCGKRYDLIVSNPPFFKDSLLSVEASKNRCRHELSLSLKELFVGASELLNSEGRLALIIPEARYDEAEALACNFALKLKRLCKVKSTLDSPVIRMLVEYSKSKVEASVVEELVIEAHRHVYTKEYKNLTREYLLDKSR